MGFSEGLKVEVRRRSDMRCCICHAVGVEVHHIIPAAEGGPDTAENAAPLCPSCHDAYGANPVKRKFIREARDNWYAVCAEKLREGIPGLEQLLESASRAVTPEDLTDFRARLLGDLTALLGPKPNGDGLKGQSLGEILRYLYDLEPDREKVARQDIEFLHFFVWGGSLHDEEVDELKEEFAEVFGVETAKRLCKYELHHHPLSLHKDGFTDPEMDKLVGVLVIGMIVLLHHEELSSSPLRLEVAINEEGHIWARLATPLTEPERPTEPDAI